MGVPIEGNKCICSLNYTDDQAIITQDANNSELVLKILSTTYKEQGLKINFNKTQFINVKTDREFALKQKKMLQISKSKTKHLGVSLKKKVTNLEDIFS